MLGTHAAVLFAGGGQATMLVRREHAPRIEETLLQEFARHTAGAPCSVACLPLSARELVEGPRGAAASTPALKGALARRLAWSPRGAGGFGACMATLSFLLRHRKGAPARAAWDESAAARCEECAERPRATDNRCIRCGHNRRQGQQGKKQFDEARDLAEILGDPAGSGSEGAEVQRARHLAFIKLDGHGVGTLLERLRTMAQYAAVSCALQRAFELDPATRDAELGKLGVSAGRYQLPIAGGDDLLIVVPGHFRRPDGGQGDALTLAADLAKRAEGAFDEVALENYFDADRDLLRHVRRLGAGVGVVLTSGIPARFCFDYASELVRSAKDAISDGEEGARSAVDFVVLRGGSPVSSSVRSLRDAQTMPLVMQLGQHRIGALRRSRCPYPLADFRRMLDRARQLARVSRAALHDLRAAMQQPEVGLLAVRYQMVRDSALRNALVGDQPLAAVPPEICEWVMAPVGNPKASTTWATGLTDLLEAARFVGGMRAEEDAG
ncbi:hypothetical protein WME98_19240 [Sorangium sp. So ce296]|uniref:hypothetical protein n=1 Tax=Sorangium sp. So ce296 TaxID=3133296 RepID=UPI003F5ED5DF